MHQGFCYNLLNPSSGPTIVHKTQKSIQTHKKAVQNSLSDVQTNLHLPSTEVTIPCGLVARIRRFHRRGRGSIPRKGAQMFFAITSGAVVYRLIHDDAYACRILVH